MTKRLFFGFPVSLSIQDELFQTTTFLLKDFSKARLVPQENYHITVSFLGEVEEEFISHFSQTARENVENISSFNLKLKEIIPAPPRGKPTMLWGVFERSHEFTSLVHSLEEKLEEYYSLPNFRKSQDPIPHITLARFKHINSLSTFAWSGERIIKCHTLTLFQSYRTPSGTTYIPLSQFHLIEASSIAI